MSFYHSGGLLEAFVESAGYDTDTGWEYDDEESPTKIRLCPSICGTIQSDATG